MTNQRSDSLFVDDERRRIDAAAPVPFAPNAFGLRFSGMISTDCYRGFWVDFELDGNSFKIKELRLAVHPGDRDEVLHGKLFDREPNDVNEFDVTSRDIPLAYTGKLVVGLGKKSAPTKWNRTKEIFCFEDGGLISRQKMELRELPEEFTPSSVWLDYGVMLWIPPDPHELENP